MLMQIDELHSQNAMLRPGIRFRISGKAMPRNK